MVLAAQVDERVGPVESPKDYVRRLAEAKARAAARLLEAPTAGTLVLAADTAVAERLTAAPGNAAQAEKHGEYKILGKPAGPQEAEKMLRRLRGRTHQVFTGLALLRPEDNGLLSRVCVTDVPMRCYSDEEISAYIASGDPFDKAGAYAIQHPGFRPVQDLSGCYANVMGLPVCEVERMLEQFDLYPTGEIIQACNGLGHACAFNKLAAAQKDAEGD